VTNKGDGRFAVTYTVTKAGPVVVAARLAATPGVRTFAAACEAGPASLPHCTAATMAEAVVVGQPGTLTFWQADRCACHPCACVDLKRSYKVGRMALVA